MDALGFASGEACHGLAAGRSLQQIAVSDIGTFVATVIERGGAVFGRRFDIAGDEVTGKEAAAILSKATGREVHFEGFPPDVLRAQSEDLAAMFKWFDRTGYAADIKSLRRDFPEVNWHTFEEWVSQQEWSVLDQSRLLTGSRHRKDPRCRKGDQSCPASRLC